MRYDSGFAYLGELEHVLKGMQKNDIPLNLVKYLEFLSKKMNILNISGRFERKTEHFSVNCDRFETEILNLDDYSREINEYLM